MEASLTDEEIEQLTRERERWRRGKPGDLLAKLCEIGKHRAALPDFDMRRPDEMIGYDENGMW